jgi:hypothetical protein
MRQLGMKQGAFLLATCLQRLLKDLKAESATMTDTFPYLRAVAAPMLLPQRIIWYPFCFRKETIV